VALTVDALCSLEMDRLVSIVHAEMMLYYENLGYDQPEKSVALIPADAVEQHCQRIRALAKGELGQNCMRSLANNNYGARTVYGLLRLYIRMTCSMLHMLALSPQSANQPT